MTRGRHALDVRLGTVTDRMESARRWAIDHAPPAFLTAPHELFIAVAMATIGIPLALGVVQPNSVHAQVPHWMAVVWSWGLLVGAVLTLFGLLGQRPRPRVEWSGQMLLGWSTAFYSAALWSFGSLEVGGVAIAVFAGMAIVSWWQAFRITSAEAVKFRLAKLARQARERAAVSGL